MKRLLIAAVAAITVGGAAYATAPSPICSGPCMTHVTTGNTDISSPRVVLAQAVTPKDTTRVETSAPVTSTTTVKGGDLAAQVIEWLQVAFGTVIAGAALWLITRVLGWFGIQTSEMQRAQLQGIVVNGLNAAAAKAQVSLRSTDKLDFSSKSQIVNDAVKYAQDHASETIKALGLDPNSGDAVEAIKARIETALNDPKTPTPPAITPPSGMSSQPLAPGRA